MCSIWQASTRQTTVHVCHGKVIIWSPLWAPHTETLQPGHRLEKRFLEGFAEEDVDEEVDGGVEDEGEVAEAGEAEDPGGRHASLLPTNRTIRFRFAAS